MGDLSAGIAATELELSKCFTDLERAVDRWLTCRTASDPDDGPQDVAGLDAKLTLFRAQIDMKCKLAIERGFSEHTRSAQLRKRFHRLMSIASHREKILRVFDF